MKHTALLAALLIGCADTRNTTLTPALSAVVDSNTAFAVDLYQHTAADHDNLIFSPLSISAALSMTFAGAAGQTAEELGAVLHIEAGDEASYHEHFGALMLDLDGKFRGYQINVASRLYGAEGATWGADFLDITETDYDAGLQEIDFSDAEGARSEINRWVERQTGGMIDALLQPDQITADTAIVLANAIYFQGDWAEAFDEAGTTAKPFTTLDGSERSVEMMHVVTDIGYAAVDGVEVGRLPYESGETSLFIVLPEAEDGLEEVEKSLTAEQIKAWDEALLEQEGTVELPRLSIASRLDLAEVLAEMGMPSAFDPATADFSAMSDREIYLDFVAHDAVIEVEESGTTAAAATAAGGNYALDAVEAEPVKLIADHPFLFFVRDDLSGAILFAGRVTAP